MTRTRRQAEALTERRARTQIFRSWLQDRLAAAQKRKREQDKARPSSTGGGHGVTVQMRSIRGGGNEWLAQHGRPSRWQRRHFHADNGSVGTWPKYLRALAENAPHVNPARDLKPKRRLRRELRS